VVVQAVQEDALVKYQIGNCMRGYVELKARTDKEAWTKGTRRIKAIIKTSKLKTDRKCSITLYLQREEPMRVTPEMAKSLQKNGQEPLTDWITVLGGNSNDPWPDDA